jgi:NADH dehydrogenase
MPDHPNVFAIGDIASLAGPDGKPLPMLAQVAVKQGLLTGHNIKKLIHSKKLLSFSYKSKGTLASVGQWKAVADIYGMRFSGPFAWFLWRTVYLFKFFSHSKKIKIIVDWTMNIFYPRDITKA